MEPACHLGNSLLGWIEPGNIPLVSDKKFLTLLLSIPQSLTKYPLCAKHWAGYWKMTEE